MKKLLLFIFITSSLTVFSKNWYLNDGSTAGDVYCTAIGTVGGTGLTPDSPKLFSSTSSNTLKSLIASAAFSPGDVIFMDAMDVQMGSASSGSEIPFNKALTIIGAGPTKTILRGPLGSAAVKFGVISSSNVVFKNFKCSGWSGVSTGSASCLDIVANSSDISGIILDGFWFDQNLGSGGDGSCRISSTGIGKVTATIKNIFSTCNNSGSYSGGFTIMGNGHNTTFYSCYFNNNQRLTNGGAINIVGTNSSDGVTTQVIIDKCTFMSNGVNISASSSVNGAAVCIAGAKLNVTNSCFSNNMLSNTSSYGTAICGLKNSRISISNSTFSSNTGAKGQVATYNFSDPSITSGTYELIVDKCSFDNSASSTAKCIYYSPSSGTFSVNNCSFTTSGGATQIYSGVAWTLTNSAITSGTNPVTGGTSPSTINTLVPSSIPTPICNGAISGTCSETTRTIDCTSDNLPPIIKGHDSTYVTNSACTFTVPTYTAIDLCDALPTFTSVPAAGTALASGTTTPVVITANDATGNNSTITVYLTTPACSSCSTLTSAAGTDKQTLCTNTALTTITYSTKADITGISNSGVAGANGLPPGVTATWSAGVITISGTPTNAATYNYSIPLVGGTCNGQTVTGTITVNSLDNASFTYPSNSFCVGIDPNPIANIIGKTGGVFSMSPSGAVFNPNTGAITLSSSISGLYALTYTTNGTCPNSQSTNISIGSGPSINNIPDQTVCSDISFTDIIFTGTPGTVYQWTNSNPAIGIPATGTGDISSFIGATTGTATITVTPKVGSCVGVTKNFNLNVNSPIIPAFSQLGPYCKDVMVAPLPTTSNNSISGTWSPALDNAVTTTYTFTPDAGQCATSTTTMTVTVNSPTTPTFTQIPAICSGATITLPSSSTNTPAIQGTWSPAINNTATTTYTFTPTVGQCANTVTMSITVNSYTSASPISGNTDICQGSTSQLTNATPGGVWSSSNTAIATVNTSGLVTAISEGVSSIKYDVTGNSSCSQSAEKPLRVIGLPIVNYVPDQQVCEGTSFNPINFSGTAGATFNWTNSDTKIGLNANGSGNINAFIAKGTIQGGSAFTSYINVTPTIGNCIGNINILKLSVSPRDNASFNYNNDLFCKNQTDPTPVILGTKGGVFSAMSNGLVVNSITGTINLSASSPGNNHSVIYKTKGLCSTNYTASFVIQSTPTVDSIPDYTICPGIFADSIKIKGTVGASFEWTNSNTKTGLTAKGQNIIYPFNAINNGTTSVISEISIIPTLGGCVGPTKKFNIVVRTTPNLSIYQVDSLVCAGGTLNFTTQLTPTTASPVYQWYVNDAKVGANSAIYWSKILKNKDKISVSVTSKDFCPKMVSTNARVDSLRLSMNVPTMVYLKAPVVNLFGYPSGGVFSGKGIANNKLDPSVLGVGNRMVRYTFKNANNCAGEITQKVIVYDTVSNNCHVTTYDTVKVSDTVSVLKVKFKLTTGIKANQETTMRVYPNPTSDILRIEVADEKAMAGYTYKIIDAAGKVVYNQLVKAAVTEIPLKTLGAVGAYFLEVLDENFKMVVSKKIILE